MVEVNETIDMEVFRFDPLKDKESRFEIFKVPLTENLTVLAALYYIYENIDSSLAYYSSCRDGVCLGCRMLINGKSALACVTLAKGKIKVEPLPNSEVIRDLVTKERKRK
ncbi:MAG: 2Fe-2S iron-sulfur cluster-binding protein [Candidatus Hodarchaeota archaeon]